MHNTTEAVDVAPAAVAVVKTKRLGSLKEGFSNKHEHATPDQRVVRMVRQKDIVLRP